MFRKEQDSLSRSIQQTDKHTSMSSNKEESSSKSEVSCQPTAKFAVLEAPGITQPAVAAAVTVTATAAASTPSSASSKQQGLQGRRAVAGSGPQMTTTGLKLGGDCFTKRTPHPDWLQSRLAVYEQIAAKRAAEQAAKQPVPITVTLPDGRVLDKDTKTAEPFRSYQTTPYHVACCISQGLADNCTVARVTYSDFCNDYSLQEDGMQGVDMLSDAMQDGGIESSGGGDDSKEDANKTFLWDLQRPLVGSVAKLELLSFDKDTDAKTVFWHSSAHMMGEALEHLYGCKLTIGPPLKGGFYYDSYMGSDAFRDEDYKPVETEVNKIIKQKQKFERLVITKEEGLQLFADNPFKCNILQTKVPDGGRTTVYKCGDLIDLCRGPHVPHTGKVKAFTATRHSATNWLGDTDNDSLQRMYGISFPDKKQLKVWQENQEKAKERDHRRIAAQQDLIMFHDLSAGSAFWLPHGARIYNKLIEFIKKHYWSRGYDEIITPNVYNLELWNISGHALHYKDAMFCFDVEGQEWAMKPMNCPGHCLMFAGAIRSYRDLPIRFADFGVLHRNELSGALTGLTRVRRFQQDDAHIYCREDQIEEEVLGALNFMRDVYETFDMTYELELSTRPKKALGDVELWVRAEKALANAMDAFAGKGGWRMNPGDGAFYGPKIDIKVVDAMDRVHQCATVQLDFQLPIRFNLQYTTASKEEGKQFARPVMIHRAMLGSVERMFAVLCEHYGGKWPLWLSPRQVMLVPVHAEFIDYCDGVRQKLHDEGFYADVDRSKNTFQKKVRNAQVAQYNFQLVVGKNEVENGTVNIRTRENKVEGEMKVEEMMAMMKRLRDEYK